ncbi:hypothetical protein Tco_1298547 [Tanacetum coccineum]
MHPFNPSCKIANSTCIFPRVKFSPHDPIVHHSGHDIKRRVKINGSSSSCMISMNITSPSSSLEQKNFVLEDWGTNPSDSSIEFRFLTCSVVMEANGSGCRYGLELVFLGLPSSCSTIADLLLGKNEQTKLDESPVLGS